MPQTTIPESITSLITKSSSNDRIAFQRRMVSLEDWVSSTISPIENQISDLKVKLIPMYDQMVKLRTDAAEHCTHAPELLMVTAEDSEGNIETVKCRFCETIFHVTS